MKESNDKEHRRMTAGRLFRGMLLGALLTGCAGPAAQPEVRLQWPPAPAAPQIVFVSEISDYKDAGIRMGFWRRLVDVVVGESDQRIGRPHGVYLDGRGRLFIVDSVFGVVHVMDKAGSSYTTIGQTGEETVFKTPIAVTGDDAGNVYITDSTAGLVYRYSFLDNTLKPFIHTLQRPTGIAFSRRKRLLYVADTIADRIAVFDLNGNARFTIGSTGSAPGKFNHPTDIFIDDAGTLYITDPLNYRVQVFSPDGQFLRTFGSPGDAGGEFLKPKGLAVDSVGNIYVADALSDTVKVYDPSGGFRFAFGSNGNSAGMFWLPSGVYIDRGDMIYVADTYNRRVQVFRRIQPAGVGGKGEVNR
jgi:sugar lactone lactonase YvrE